MWKFKYLYLLIVLGALTAGPIKTTDNDWHNWLLAGVLFVAAPPPFAALLTFVWLYESLNAAGISWKDYLATDFETAKRLNISMLSK